MLKSLQNALRRHIKRKPKVVIFELKMIFVQVCSCVRPAPEDAQLCSEHPVLHDVRGDGADLAHHGEQPENREGNRFNKSSRRSNPFPVLTVCSPSSGFEH